MFAFAELSYADFFSDMTRVEVSKLQKCPEPFFALKWMRFLSPKLPHRSFCGTVAHATIVLLWSKNKKASCGVKKRKRNKRKCKSSNHHLSRRRAVTLGCVGLCCAHSACRLGGGRDPFCQKAPPPKQGGRAGIRKCTHLGTRNERGRMGH